MEIPTAEQKRSSGLTIESPVALAAATAGIGAVIGSLGPWLKATIPFLGTITVNGTDSNNDGVITLIAGAIAGILMLVVALRATSSRNASLLVILGILGFIVVGGVAIYDWVNLSNKMAGLNDNFKDLISPGWGIYLTVISGVAGLVFGLLTFKDLKPS